ncbi:MAG: Tad domain-containing protein, partial [Planctomycetes bacterium]|nr:Tad domain-containing protein [Planctomycetota bacterium]
MAVGRFPGRLHRDEQGTISIISVFAVLLLTMLLGMVMNAGRRVDGKVRMQNAADAAAHSGGVVLARGMNTLSFTNHLLCDVFALTAFMREARDGNATAQSPEILESWSGVASVLETSGI